MILFLDVLFLYTLFFFILFIFICYFKEQEDNSPPIIAGTTDDSVCVNHLVYRVGDFVYAEAPERGQELMILNIQRLWTDQNSQQMLYGNHFYRPSETYHLSTRKFLEKVSKILICILITKFYF